MQGTMRSASGWLDNKAEEEESENEAVIHTYIQAGGYSEENGETRQQQQSETKVWVRACADG